MHTFEDFVTATQRATRREEIEILFRRHIAEEGFDNYVLATIIDGRMTAIPWCDLPDGYAEDYLANRWSRIDPVYRATLASVQPVRWQTIETDQHLSHRERKFMAECRTLGVHSGLSFPIHGPGQRLDLISISMRNRETIDPNRLNILHAICLQAITRYNTIAAPKRQQVHMVGGLTQRELECLNWLKEGKTIPEIAQILGVSTKTIEFHVGNVYRKLGANNRTGAVVLGIQQGLIPV